jgi:Xaa-Pro aminopeptidase
MELQVGAQAEVDVKLARVRAFLEREGLAGALLSRQDNFAWLSGGRDNHVVAGSEVGVASLLVTPDGQFALADRIEAGRLRDEEIGEQRWEWRVYDWFRPGARAAAVREIVGDGVVAADTPGAGARQLDRAFDELRAELLPEEVARYRAVGRIATLAVVEAGLHLHPGQSEHEIAADLARRVRAQGGRPGVVLIATDERIHRFRHPIPTDRKLRDSAMLVLGASKWGLQVSVTRFVSFRPLGEELKRKWRDVSQIAAYFTLATRPGRGWAEIFRGATDLYRRLGWEEEWQLHHQGGPTGYRGREFTANPESEGEVSAVQAAAWNPSITGTKSEDTIVAAEGGHEFLTRHGEWPVLTVEHEGRQLTFADVLVRQQVVRRYA